MQCRRCESARIGLIDAVPDASAAGPSHRAVGMGTFHQHQVRDRGGEGIPRHADANEVHRHVHSTASTWTKLLSLLFSRKSVQHYSSTTKVGTIESLVCADCGLVSWRVQDPQWVEWTRLPSFSTSAEGKQMLVRSCRNCAATELGLLSSLPDTVDDEQTMTEQVIGVAHDGTRVGRLQAIVCTKCGLLEPFVAAPDEVPFESIKGFSWLEGDGGTSGTPDR